MVDPADWTRTRGMRRMRAALQASLLFPAARLSRSDPRVGYVAAIDPRTSVRPAPGVRLLVHSGPGVPGGGASRTWARWRVEVPEALLWLAEQGFGAEKST